MRRVTLTLAAILLFLSAPLAAEPDLRPLMTKVEALRGLRFKKDVPVQSVDPAAMKAVIQRELAKEYPEDQWPAMEKTLKVFGLIPPRMNLRAVVAAMLEEQVVGLYDPDGKRMFVNAQPLGGGELLSELGLGDLKMQDVYLVHELDHALTDQVFDLKKLPMEDRENEDRASAARCVAEGDATWVMLRYLYQVMKVPPDQQKQMGDLMASMGLGKELMGQAAPAYLQENLLVAYLGGMDLVKAAYERDGFAGVNALYLHPPQSMEEVLHPDKYFSGKDPPIKVRAELPAGWAKAGWTILSRGVWGEMNARIILEEWGVDERAATRAAEGWGGDGYVVAENAEGQTAFAWMTQWDTERDAREFASAMGKVPGLRIALRGDRVGVTKGGPSLASKGALEGR
jgi:hypothetical protein